MERARQLHEMAEQLREEAEARGGLDELAEKQIDGLQRWAKHFGRNATEAEISAVGRMLGGGAVAGDGRWSGAPVATAYRHDPGRAFVESEGFKAICDPTGRPERYSTGLVDVGPYGAMEMKGTLGESASTAIRSRDSCRASGTPRSARRPIRRLLPRRACVSRLAAATTFPEVGVAVLRISRLSGLLLHPPLASGCPQSRNRCNHLRTTRPLC